jgi:hypothetical protein
MSLKDIKIGTGGKQAFCDGDHPGKCSTHGKPSAQPAERHPAAEDAKPETGATDAGKR